MKRTLRVPRDFSLRSTVLSHGYVQTAPFGWDEKTLARVDRMKRGGRPHRVLIRQKGQALELEVVGARSIPESFVARVRRMLQLDMSLAPFHRVISKEPHLKWIAKGKFGRILRTGDLFEDVVKAICGTNVQWTQAVKMANVICTLGPKVGGHHAFPTPDEVIAAGASWLRAKARVGYRADYIVTLAKDVKKNALDREAFENEAPDLTGEQIRKRLLAIKGIGPSTARYLSAFFGKFDAVSVDSAVINYATRAHFAGKKPSQKLVEKHFDRYGEFRGLVCWFEVWKDYRDARDLGL